MKYFKNGLAIASLAGLTGLATACSGPRANFPVDYEETQQQASESINLSDLVDVSTEASKKLNAIAETKYSEVKCVDDINPLLAGSNQMDQVLSVTTEADLQSDNPDSARLSRMVVALQAISNKTENQFCKINLNAEVAKRTYTRLIQEPLMRASEDDMKNNFATYLDQFTYARNVAVTIEGLNKIHMTKVPNNTEQQQLFTNETHNMIKRVQEIMDTVSSQTNRCDLVKCSVEDLAADAWLKEAQKLITAIEGSFQSGSPIAYDLDVMKKHVASLRGIEKTGFDIQDLVMKDLREEVANSVDSE